MTRLLSVLVLIVATACAREPVVLSAEQVAYRDAACADPEFGRQIPGFTFGGRPVFEVRLGSMVVAPMQILSRGVADENDGWGVASFAQMSAVGNARPELKCNFVIMEKVGGRSAVGRGEAFMVTGRRVRDQGLAEPDPLIARSPRERWIEIADRRYVGAYLGLNQKSAFIEAVSKLGWLDRSSWVLQRANEPQHGWLVLVPIRNIGG